MSAVASSGSLIGAGCCASPCAWGTAGSWRRRGGGASAVMPWSRSGGGGRSGLRGGTAGGVVGGDGEAASSSAGYVGVAVSSRNSDGSVMRSVMRSAIPAPASSTCTSICIGVAGLDAVVERMRRRCLNVVVTFPGDGGSAGGVGGSGPVGGGSGPVGGSGCGGSARTPSILRLRRCGASSGRGGSASVGGDLGGSNDRRSARSRSVGLGTGPPGAAPGRAAPTPGAVPGRADRLRGRGWCWSGVGGSAALGAGRCGGGIDMRAETARGTGSSMPPLGLASEFGEWLLALSVALYTLADDATDERRMAGCVRCDAAEPEPWLGGRSAAYGCGSWTESRAGACEGDEEAAEVARE
jgi:hypothetical protein